MSDKPLMDGIENEQSGRRKPLVHYMEIITCELGKRALVVPADHPSEWVSNTQPVVTSEVVNGLDALGSFETMNTRYVRAPGMSR